MAEGKRNSTETVKENPYCKLVLAHPKVCFSLTLACHIITILATVLLNVFGYDILPLNLSQLPMRLEQEDVKLQGDAWKFVASDPRVTWNLNDPKYQTSESVRMARYDVLEIYYQDKHENNVFTKEKLQKIQAFEESLYNNSVYQKKLCLLDGNKKCKLPLSIIRFFDGTYKHFDPLLYDPDFQNIPKVLNLVNTFFKVALKYHVAKDVQVTPTEFTSSVTRSMFFTGFPFEGFKSTHDRQVEQLQRCRELAWEAFGDVLDDMFSNGLGDTKVMYLMNCLMMNAIQRQVVWDLLLVCGSFGFIFLFILVQTQSLWITGWSIFSILSSFFEANIIYRIVLDYRYIGVFHVLTIFIIAGIGADDVFVFYDTWRGSKDKDFPNLLQRFSYTYKHAAGAMLTTSVTTFVAFLTNAFSPLLALSSFGVFSALIVLVNYLSIILFFPTVIITYELYWKDWKWPCCRWHRNKVDPVQSQEGVIEENVEDGEKISTDPTRSIAKFIGETFYSKVVGHKVVRYIVVALALVIIIVSIVFAVKLVPDEEQIDLMGPGTNWYDAKRLRETSFNPSEEDNYFRVYIIWGLQNQNRSSCHSTDFMCRGETKFDPSFDISIPPCQMALLELCKEFKNLPEEKMDELKMRRNQVTNAPTVKCFIEAMETYFQQESKKKQYPKGTDFRLPLNSNKVQTLMKYNPKIYNISKITDKYYRYFEVAIAHWLTQGNTSYNAPDFKTYKHLIGGTLDTTLNSSNIFQGGEYGNQLLYMAVTIETTLTVSTLGYVEGIKVIDAWKNFIDKKMKSFPLPCRKVFPATPELMNPWHWINVQKVLVENAIRGVCLGLALTLPILVIMTGNWIIALLCMLSIACTTLGVLGIIPMIGWKLGVLESLNLTLVVGLAVDYVVHLAEGYLTCPETSRQDRVKYTLSHVGISVLSGAFTTLGAAVFMFAAKILFFFQFGIFIFCTIGFSLLFAFFFFMTLLVFLGPQGNAGSLKVLRGYLKDKVRGKQPNEVPCIRCGGKGFHGPQVDDETQNNNSEKL